MEVKEVTVTKGVTVKIGKWESIRVDASLKINLDNTDDSDSVFETGYELCDEQINKQILEMQDIIGRDSVFRIDKTAVKETNKKSSRRRRK